MRKGDANTVCKEWYGKRYEPIWLMQPWQPEEVARFFSTLTVPWWIAGGWALDLFLGVQTRDHEDIDVQILRRDQQEVRTVLREWDVQGAHPEELPAEWPFREWEPGRLLSPSVHDVWCRPNKTSPWAIQLMIVDTTDDQWLFRRDARIRRPLAAVGHRTNDGIPYLAPEIQLLYKAKAPRPKDEADFARTLPSLDWQSHQWLAQSLALFYHYYAAPASGTCCCALRALRMPSTASLIRASLRGPKPGNWRMR